ncbi:UNVERIFIED_CONTAM: hypothetical protein FKN15_053485 [Acipenser sinensis]
MCGGTEGAWVINLSRCWYGNGAGAAPLPQLGATPGLHGGEARGPNGIGALGGLGPGNEGGDGDGGEGERGRLLRRAGADRIPIRAEFKDVGLLNASISIYNLQY